MGDISPVRERLAPLVAYHLSRAKSVIGEEAFAAAAAGQGGKIGVVGAGVMGCSVAATAAAWGADVLVYDVAATAADRVTRITDRLPTAIVGYDADHPVARDSVGGCSFAGDLDALADCDLIIESVTEDIQVKRGALVELESRLPEQTVIGSNTSTIPIGRLGLEMRRPDRLVGMHFFHPVWQCPLIEIARGPGTSDEAYAAAIGRCLAWRRLPLLAPDTPGFIVNRLLLAYGGEAMRLLIEGVDPERMNAAVEAQGVRWGPLRMLDEVGLDTVFRCGWRLAEVAPRAAPKEPILAKLVKAGMLGRKSGVGFLRYGDGQPLGVNPAAAHIIETYRQDPPPAAAPRTDQEIVARILRAIAAEGQRIIDENPDARSQHDIDAGMILGLGFPAQRNGWAARRGAFRAV